MDEDQTTVQAENTSVAEDSNQDTSPVDEQNTSTSEETDNQPSSAEETVEDTDTDVERKPTRAERRIRDLVEQNKRLQAQNQAQVGLQQPQLNVQPPDPGQEYDSYDQYAQKYQNDVVQAANTIAALQTQQQLQQFQAQQNLDRDADVLPTQYPELNPDSDEYNEAIIEAIEEDFKERAFVNGQLNPSVRLSDIAKRHIKVARAAAKKSSSAMKNAVAMSADTSALRPTQNTTTDKSAADMSIEEMEKRFGFAQQ